MYAIIETGNQQYRVASGDKIDVEKLPAEAGAEVILDRVLALVKEGNAVFGEPYLSNMSVKAEVVKNGKKEKVMIFKQRPRKGYRRLRGHRQQFTTLKITEIKEA